MRKVIFPILISLLLPVSSAHAFNTRVLNDHFKIHYAAIGAVLGLSKGAYSLVFDKKIRKLSFSKKAEYLGRCTFSGLVIGSLGGAYVSAVIKNCQHQESPEMSREPRCERQEPRYERQEPIYERQEVVPPNHCITISPEALNEYRRITNVQCNPITTNNGNYIIPCTDFLGVANNDNKVTVGNKYRQSCLKFHPNGQGRNHTHSDEIIRVITNAGERLKYDNRF